VADVAEAAKVSPALVIYYFGTLHRLLTEALRYSEDFFYGIIAERLAKADGAAARLEVAVRFSCEPQVSEGMPGAWVLWLDLWAQSMRHPELASFREQLDAQWRSLIADLVREGQRAGVFGPTDPEAFALTLCALLDGLALQVALADPVVTGQRAARLAMDVCRMALGPAWPQPDDPPGSEQRPESAQLTVSAIRS
jgi:AcrR family transcriptional regulator